MDKHPLLLIFLSLVYDRFFFSLLIYVLINTYVVFSRAVQIVLREWRAEKCGCSGPTLICVVASSSSLTLMSPLLSFNIIMSWIFAPEIKARWMRGTPVPRRPPSPHATAVGFHLQNIIFHCIAKLPVQPKKRQPTISPSATLLWVFLYHKLMFL